MVKKQNTLEQEPEERHLSKVEMERAIPKIKQRLVELNELNPDELTERGDIRFSEVETKTN